MTKAKNMCCYKYGRGIKNGQICGKKCIGDYCAKHKRNTKTEIPKDEIEMEDTQMSNDDEMEEDEETDYEESIAVIPKTKNKSKTKPDHSDDILITKYFVNDCIREFFRDHNEISDLLGKKSSSPSTSSMTSIMGMAGISLIPILMRNLSNMSINDAVHKQGYTGEVCSSNRCNSEAERETRNNYGKYEVSEATKESVRTENSQDERRDSCSTERILEVIKRNTKA